MAKTKTSKRKATTAKKKAAKKTVKKTTKAARSPKTSDAKKSIKAPAASPVASASKEVSSATGADSAPEASAKKRSTAETTKGSRRSSEKMSALDAAVRVLKEHGKPMRVKPLVEAMIAKGLWASVGKTPWATLHAAICREIEKKGKEARFKKAGRGFFDAS